MFDCFSSVYESHQDVNKKATQCISLNIGFGIIKLMVDIYLQRSTYPRVSPSLAPLRVFKVCHVNGNYLLS